MCRAMQRYIAAYLSRGLEFAKLGVSFWGDPHKKDNLILGPLCGAASATQSNLPVVRNPES